MISLPEVGHFAADESGFDGELAVAAVDEHGELDAARASVIEEGVEGGTNGAAGVEDVVDQDDVLVLDVELHGAGADLGAMADGGEVVAVESDVEGADGDAVFLDAARGFWRDAGPTARRDA